MNDARALATGLDVSQWQGNNFPFQRAAEAGCSFCYIRASVRTSLDPHYHLHRERAIDAGLLTGSYHYLYPEPRPQLQAHAFCHALARRSTQPDPLPPALDVEELGLTEAQILQFVASFRQLTDTHLVIYTSRRAWYHIAGRDAQWPAQHPLWVADWQGNDEPALPCPWQHWSFWQWTSRGEIPGYRGNVDLNYYNGTAGQLRDRYPVPSK